MKKKVVKKAQKSRKLTKKRQAFVREYVVDRNGTKAAERAGFSKRTAGKIAHELLKKPEIQIEIEKLEAAKQKKNELTVEWVIAELQKNIAKASQTIPVLDSKGKPTGIYRYDSAAVNKALELLGRYLNIFEGHQKAGATNVTVENLTDDELFAKVEQRYFAMKVAREEKPEEEALN